MTSGNFMQLQATLKGLLRLLLPGLLLSSLAYYCLVVYNTGPRPLERCLSRFKRERASSPLEVVHLGGVEVAAQVGEPRGAQLWACSQVMQALYSASPSCQGEGEGRCMFLELGGPGLCAFYLAKEMPGLAISLLPFSLQAANVSSALNGGMPNVRLLGWSGDSGSHTLLEEILQSLPEGERGANGTKADAKPVTGPLLVVQVNLHHSVDNATLNAQLEIVQKLLERGAVEAAVVLLPTGEGAGATQDKVAAATAVRRRVADIVSTAAAVGLRTFWGGFDGFPVSEQHLRDGRWPTAADSTANSEPPLSPPPELSTVTTLFLAQRRAPPPAVHLLVPLHVTDQAKKRRLVGALCRYLLDTAALNNLKVHVVGLTLTGKQFSHRFAKTQKLPVLLHALTTPSVAPSDIVITMDAVDTLVQAPATALRKNYLRAGAPVLSVATEVNCWPPQFRPWCRFYEPAPKIPLQQGGKGQRLRQLTAEAEIVNASSLLPNTYINGGGIVGRAVVVAKYLQDVVDHLQGRVTTSSWLPDGCTCLLPDDQALRACAYLFDDNPYSMTMDYRADFFYSVFLASQHLAAGTSERRWIYNLTSTLPFAIHANGWDGKNRLEELRSLIVGSETSGADSEYVFMLDGQRTRYEEVCPSPSEEAWKETEDEPTSTAFNWLGRHLI